MINLGEIQTLAVMKKTDHGVYLHDPYANDSDTVLLPKNQVTSDINMGSLVDVFIYKDSEDRLIATTTVPKITLEELAVLSVVEVNNIGAFLDWGLQKDLLLPFCEQKTQVKTGDKVLAALYIDKSSRLCATTKIYDRLSCDSPYVKDEKVNGIVFDVNPNYGAFVAVDNKYLALLPSQEFFTDLKIGDTISARITDVRPDGKINISMRGKIKEQMDIDSKNIYSKLMENGGFLPYNDKTNPDIIKKEFQLSKNSFKRAIGRLYKEGLIVILDDGIHDKN